jgi:hypothetical protein
MGFSGKAGLFKTKVAFKKVMAPFSSSRNQSKMFPFQKNWIGSAFD